MQRRRNCQFAANDVTTLDTTIEEQLEDNTAAGEKTDNECQRSDGEESEEAVIVERGHGPVEPCSHR